MKAMFYHGRHGNNFPQAMKKLPVDALKSWFLAARRDLPWRKEPSPYAVWVSEIMLQQTQVTVVEEYFLRWMARFPTIKTLASASLEEVIKMWEGLGYYSRARNMHEAAKYLVEHHRGELPAGKEDLAKVKGLGPYTVGAILSFAFHQKAAAVDGNTVRVLTRYFGIDEDVQKSGTMKKLWEIAEGILPKSEPWLVVEGLIELGATVCKREPLCSQCPLMETCTGFKEGTAKGLPKKGKKVEITSLQRQVFVVIYEGELLVKKAGKGKIMADLYEFPYSEMDAAQAFPFSFRAEKIQILPEVEHSFTRYRARLYPSLWKAHEKMNVPDCQWVHLDRIHSYPFSSGHRKILKLVH